MFNEEDIYPALRFDNNLYIVYDPDSEKFCILFLPDGSIIPGSLEAINIQRLIKWDKENNFQASL